MSYSPFVKAEVQPLPWIRFSGGVRGEFFTFDVSNRCATCVEQPDGRKGSGIVLPKMSMILGPWAKTEFFVNYGEGFHSNDARSAVAIGASPLARARSYEVGVRSRPWGPQGLELIATAWRLDLKSELVLVGDEGTTEIRGATRRQGVEVAARGASLGPALRQWQLYLDPCRISKRRRYSFGAGIHGLWRGDSAMARGLDVSNTGDVPRSSAAHRGSEHQVSFVDHIRSFRAVSCAGQIAPWSAGSLSFRAKPVQHQVGTGYLCVRLAPAERADGGDRHSFCTGQSTDGDGWTCLVFLADCGEKPPFIRYTEAARAEPLEATKSVLRVCSHVDVQAPLSILL
ncbi:MAG: TonB-dependent receptor [Nitrospira sp.]|nr:TonB-dependent receptor [Nitrospira sp.]